MDVAEFVDIARPVADALDAAHSEGIVHSRHQAREGGFDKLREAGVCLLGGHTVQNPEIKFGYAVTGAVDPAKPRVLIACLEGPR